jgi:hypothetical protein
MLRAWPLVLQPRISATGERTTASNTSSINVSGGKDAKTNEENMTDQRPIRISKADRQIIERMAAGWRPLKAQIPHGNQLEKRRLLRLDWGAEGSSDEDRMCWYLTDLARALLAQQTATKEPPANVQAKGAFYEISSLAAFRSWAV